MYGAAAVGDSELLSVVLGARADSDRETTTAARILALSGGLDGLASLGTHDLSQCAGIGRARAARILAAVELGSRVLHRRLTEERGVLGSFDAVVAWAHPRLAALDHEEVWLLCLDGRNALRRAERIARGGLHGCALTPRDVLRPAVRDAASAMVLVHNHPSGDPTPSSDDVAMTRAVAEAGRIVGVHLVDHVVVARQGAASVLDHR